MKAGYILLAAIMFLYLAASFLGSGDIGILYVLAAVAQTASGGKLPFEGVYEAGLAVYVIVMISLFLIGGKRNE